MGSSLLEVVFLGVDRLCGDMLSERAAAVVLALLHAVAGLKLTMVEA